MKKLLLIPLIGLTCHLSATNPNPKAAFKSQIDAIIKQTKIQAQKENQPSLEKLKDLKDQLITIKDEMNKELPIVEQTQLMFSYDHAIHFLTLALKKSAIENPSDTAYWIIDFIDALDKKVKQYQELPREQQISVDNSLKMLNAAAEKVLKGLQQTKGHDIEKDLIKVSLSSVNEKITKAKLNQ